MLDNALHPATRELFGIGVYVVLIVSTTAAALSLRRRTTTQPSVGRSLLSSVTGIGIAALAGWLISAVVNPIFNADFCVYLILGVATIGGVIIAAVLSSRQIPLRPSSMTMLLVLATMEVLAIPAFLLGG